MYLFSRSPGEEHPHGVHEELGEPHELEGGPDEGGGDDVVNEEGAVVRQEDAAPDQPVVTRALTGVDEELEEGLERGQADGRQDQHHEQQVEEDLVKGDERKGISDGTASRRNSINCEN